MDNRVVVYGASDDLIEIEGGGIHEEFYGGNDEGEIVAFSNGVVLSIKYDGEWKIRPLQNGHLVQISIAPGDDAPIRDEDDCPNYSDKAVFDGPIYWAVCAIGDENYVKARP